MRDVDLDFRLCSAQGKAYAAFQPGATVCIPWGRGIGKSWFMRTESYLSVARYDGKPRPGTSFRGVRQVMLMPTLEQFRKVHQELIEAELEGPWKFLGGKFNRSTWRISYPGGSWFQCVTAERAQNARGIRCDQLFGDETDDIERGVFDGVVKPWFSEPWSLRMQMVGGTPRRGRGGSLYYYAHELPKLLPGKAFSFHATAYDAPRLVDPAYLEEVKATTPDEIFRREWLCDFDSAEGLVYPQFMPGFHVKEPPSDVVWTEMIFGADHGYEDPGVILLCGVLGHGRDAQLWVLDEVYERHRPPDWWEDHVTQFVGWYPTAKWYPDSARPDIAAAWKRKGARVQEVSKGAGSIEAGVAEIQRFLHVRSRKKSNGESEEYARLYVHPRCVNLIREFQLYRRKREGRDAERMSDQIEGKNDHALDGLRYGIVGRFGLSNLPSARNDANADYRQ